jgi:putative membrane protein
LTAHLNPRGTIMLRRHILAAAATLPVAAVATRAFAQDAAAPAMGEAETTHATQTGMVGSLSLLQSRLAVTKASDDMVRQFAEFEVAEQETVGDILKSMKMSPDEAQGALMPPTDEEAMAMIDDAGRAKLEELEALSGAEFDAAYVAANLEGHQQLLAIQEEYLTVGEIREHLSVAKLARGHITEHIARLEQLQADLG